MKNIQKIAIQILKESRLIPVLVDLTLDYKKVHVDLANRVVKNRIEEQLKQIDGFNGIISFVPVLNIEVNINLDTEKSDPRTFKRDVVNRFKNFRTPSLRIQ
jgi:hypothetical protein